MEAVYEAVVTRLAMLGYTVTDDDKTGLEGAPASSFLYACGHGGRSIPV